jgi:aerobic-type carbon monoxide dehydrogenase small subunit (CoxS/CutS family)
MSPAGFRSVLPPGNEIAVTVDGVALTLQRGRSLLAALLLSDRAGAAADFFCAIGQCQRCLVVMDDRAVLACLAYPKGGEAVSTQAMDRRPPPWS